MENVEILDYDKFESCFKRTSATVTATLRLSRNKKIGIRFSGGSLFLKVINVVALEVEMG